VVCSSRRRFFNLQKFLFWRVAFFRSNGFRTCTGWPSAHFP
jgi:hypothetical protein